MCRPHRAKALNSMCSSHRWRFEGVDARELGHDLNAADLHVRIKGVLIAGFPMLQVI